MLPLHSEQSRGRACLPIATPCIYVQHFGVHSLPQSKTVNVPSVPKAPASNHFMSTLPKCVSLEELLIPSDEKRLDRTPSSETERRMTAGIHGETACILQQFEDNCSCLQSPVALQLQDRLPLVQLVGFSQTGQVPNQLGYETVNLFLRILCRSCSQPQMAVCAKASLSVLGWDSPGENSGWIDLTHEAQSRGI